MRGLNIFNIDKKNIYYINITNEKWKNKTQKYYIDLI